MTTALIDKDEVKTAITADPTGFYGRVLPGATLKRDGERRKTNCPLGHSDSDPSFVVFPDGGWKCFSCGEGGDGIALLQKLRGLDFSDALTEAGGILGMRDAPPKHQGETNPTKRFQIIDAAGNLVAEHCRVDIAPTKAKPEGDKKLWWERDGKKGLDGLRLADLPLYNLPALLAADASALVVVTEGEKAADALRQAGQLAVGTVTGANAKGKIPSDDSLRPLLGHIIQLWADADEVGRCHMDAISERLQALGGTSCRVTWTDAPPKGDAADFLLTHSAEELRDLLTTATQPEPMLSVEASRPEPTILMPITFAELEGVVSETSWAWPGYLPNGALTILFAPPEAGKSYLGLDLMRCVTTGADWPDGSPNDGPPEKCLLIDFEGTQSEYLDRAKACGIPLDMLLTQPPDVLPYLTDAASFDAFRRWLAYTEARFMVIDSWRDGAPGVNEDSSGEVAPTLTPLKMIARDFDISIVLHQHPTKQQGKAWSMSMADLRGSGAFAAAARVILAIDKPNANSDARLLRVVKRNSGPKPEPLGFEIGDDGITWTDPVYHHKPSPKMDAAKQAIRDALRPLPLAHKELREALLRNGVAKRTGDEALALMRDTGQVIVGPDGRYGLVSPLTAAS